MRRDVFISNDSGGLSVAACDAIDAIIDDGRSDDLRFVTSYKALLLELYGDDSMPVRIVVDEPLTVDEEAQWLARATWRIDASDGSMVVMGGFDPDVMGSWKDATSGKSDGAGVALIEAGPGSWQVDVYAHVGSMNGRQILAEADSKPGAAFRKSHADRPFPLWLARILQFSKEDDPGFEDLWDDVRASVAASRLSVDIDTADPIGFLVHLAPLRDAVGDPPEGGWFDRNANARLPAVFPLGVPSSVPDPELRSFRDDILGREAPAVERAIAEDVVEIMQAWTGDPLKAIQGGGEPIAIDPSEAHLLYWIAALGADSPPRFELWVEAKGPWQAPAATPDFAVLPKGAVVAMGPARNAAGWQLWWAARDVAAALAGVPDGSTLDFGMAPRVDRDPDLDPTVGRALYSGTVRGGKWHLKESSPLVARDALADALAFVRVLSAEGRLSVRPGAEREIFDAQAAVSSREEGSLVWEGEFVLLADPDDRTLLTLAAPVFRTRFGQVWPMDAPDQ